MYGEIKRGYLSPCEKIDTLAGKTTWLAGVDEELGVRHGMAFIDTIDVEYSMEHYQ